MVPFIRISVKLYLRKCLFILPGITFRTLHESQPDNNDRCADERGWIRGMEKENKRQIGRRKSQVESSIVGCGAVRLHCGLWIEVSTGNELIF